MKIVSWNLNSLMAHKDEFLKGIEVLDPDVFCIQKLQTKAGKPVLCPEGYYVIINPPTQWWNYGTAIFYKQKPISYSLDSTSLLKDYGGRIVVYEAQDYFIICVYVPYTSRGNISTRQYWDAEFEKLIHKLQQHKPVIICGDMNIVHEAVDVFDLKNIKKEGCYMPEEHEDFQRLLSNEQLVDAYRTFNPVTQTSFDLSKRGQFTTFPKGGDWYERNMGARLDYLLVSASLMPRVEQCYIRDEFKAKVSCPIVLELR